MFINYYHNQGRITVTSYRGSVCYFGDIVDLAKAIESGNESISCPLEGADQAINDGSLWEGVSAETLEQIAWAINESQE